MHLKRKSTDCQRVEGSLTQHGIVGDMLEDDGRHETQLLKKKNVPKKLEKVDRPTNKPSDNGMHTLYEEKFIIC